MQSSEYWAQSSSQDSEGAEIGNLELEIFPSYSDENIAGEEGTIQNTHFQPENPPGASSGTAWIEFPSSVHAESLSHPPVGLQHTTQMTVGSEVEEDPHPREQSLQDFSEYLFGKKGKRNAGNWPDLLATSLNWCLLDFSFYLLNVNSTIVSAIFVTPKDQAPHAVIYTNEWHALVATSIGAVLGGAIAIIIMNNFSRKKIQMWSFLALGCLFLLLGVLFITEVGRGAVAAVVALYILCQLAFNIGPYLIPKSRA